MKIKRIVSVILTAVLLSALFAAVPAGVSAATVVTVTATNPVILADVGETIDLANYAVQIDSSTTLEAGQITWTSGGSTVTSFKPASADVFPLVASKDSASRTVYVVAKEAADTEYVLYENDFNSGSWEDLEKEGWRNVTGCPVTVSGGALHIDAKTTDVQQTLFPEWLADFGDFCVTALVNETDVRDNSRWCSVLYRCEDKYNSSAKHYYPFYQMAVRAHTTSSSIEFAERTSSDGWNVITTISRSFDMTQAGKYHVLTVKAFESTVEYQFDEESVFYTTEAKAHTKGDLGFNTNYGVMNVDSLRITVQAEQPERKKPVPILVNTAVNRIKTNISSAVSNQAFTIFSELDKVLSGSVLPAGVVIDIRGEDITQEQFVSCINKCKEKNVIPEFELNSEAMLNVLNKALEETGLKETLVVSENADIVKKAREKNKTVIRGALDITGIDTEILHDKEIFSLYQEAVGSYAQIILLPQALSTKETVEKFQIYELSVWASDYRVTAETEAAWLIASGANGVLSDNPALIASVQNKYFTEANSVTRTPVWTAHRGYFVNVPENSMPAFKAGYENGADQIEIDVHLTSDNVIVICHDDTIDRTFNGKGSIANMTYEQLLQYRMMHNGKTTDEVIPTFEEFLKYFKGKDVKVLCELKSSQVKLAPACVEMIKKYGMEDQVMFISFNETQLTRAKQNMNVSTGDLNVAVSGGFDESEVEAILNAYYDCQVKALSYHSTMAMSYGGITPEFIRDANDRGLTIWSWTYTSSTKAEVSRNFLNGMNGMTTNDITMLKNTVKRISTDQTLYVMPGKTTSYRLNAVTYGRVSSNVTGKAKIITLQNDGVAQIGSDGSVKGLKNGTAVFMLSYTSKLPDGSSYTLYTQPVTVVVGKEIPNVILREDSDYEVSYDRITGVPEKVKVSEFRNSFVGGEQLRILDAKGKEVKEDAFVGTGMTVETGSDSKTVVIKGELTGDGEVNITDYLLIKSAALHLKTLDEFQTVAANIDDSEDPIPDVTDYLKVKGHVLGNYNLYD